MFSNTIFSRFYFVSASENRAKIELFSHGFQKKRNNVKVNKTLRGRMNFEGRLLKKHEKIHPKSMPKRNRKKHRKKPPKNRFWPPFWLPKTPQNRPNIGKNRKKTLSKKSIKKQLPEIKLTYRNSSLLGPRRTIQPSFQ